MSQKSSSSGNLWRHLLVAGCLVVGMSSAAVRADDTKPADPPTTPPPARGEGGRPDGTQMLKIMRERLDQLELTDDQKKKIDAIYATAAEDLKKDAGDRQAMAKVLLNIREQVAGVLTDEQKAKMPQRAAGGATGAGGMRNLADRLEAALDKADLSADQKAKTKPIVEDVRKKFEELRGQIQSGDRDALREKFKALMDDTRDKLKDILTPEQAEKVKAALEAGRPAGAAGRPGATPPAKPADK